MQKNIDNIKFTSEYTFEDFKKEMQGFTNMANIENGLYNLYDSKDDLDIARIEFIIEEFNTQYSANYIAQEVYNCQKENWQGLGWKVKTLGNGQIIVL